MNEELRNILIELIELIEKMPTHFDKVEFESLKKKIEAMVKYADKNFDVTNKVTKAKLELTRMLIEEGITNEKTLEKFQLWLGFQIGETVNRTLK